MCLLTLLYGAQFLWIKAQFPHILNVERVWDIIVTLTVPLVRKCFIIMLCFVFSILSSFLSVLSRIPQKDTPVATARKSAVASVVKFDDEPKEIGDDDVSPTALAVLERLTQ